jgi:hypothetical protein
VERQSLYRESHWVGCRNVRLCHCRLPPRSVEFSTRSV